MFCFFFNDTATTEIYTLSLHDALPIFRCAHPQCKRILDVEESPKVRRDATGKRVTEKLGFRIVSRNRPNLQDEGDRKSTRLNSSHANISYAVFCLKKKKIPRPHTLRSP